MEETNVPVVVRHEALHGVSDVGETWNGGVGGELVAIHQRLLNGGSESGCNLRYYID